MQAEQLEWADIVVGLNVLSVSWHNAVFRIKLLITLSLPVEIFLGMFRLLGILCRKVSPRITEGKTKVLLYPTAVSD